MAEKKIRVVVVDDHQVVRQGIRAMLRLDKRIEIVREAETGAEALKAVAETRPDVVIMDVRLPDMSGIDATARIAKRYRKIKVLGISAEVHEETVRAFMQAGGSGFFAKTFMARELAGAVMDAAKGQRRFGFGIERMIQDDYGKEHVPNPFLKLTERQRDIVQGVLRGKMTKEIAGDLGIAGKTGEWHRNRAFKSLGVSTPVELVIKANAFGFKRFLGDGPILGSGDATPPSVS